MSTKISISAIAALAFVACTQSQVTGSKVSESGSTAALTSAIPADRLATIKAALPQVAYPELQRIFAASDTYWYDHESMAPSYQETGKDPNGDDGGARDNAHWIDLVVPGLGGDQIYDRNAQHWRFPFATTFGTDDATNIQVVNFLSLPRDSAGNLQSIPLSTGSDQIHVWWQWQYPNGTTVGEVVFIKDASGSLMPAEVRLRRRYAGGWATNAFRPFPTATALSAAIKTHRPAYATSASLTAMVQHLDGSPAFTTKQLTAEGLPGTFDQTGSLDVLPDFGDEALVRELLTTTTFASAYATSWKENGDAKAYAASTASDVSIVPKNYTAGILAVTEDSCMRCHKESGREIEQWYPQLSLYGEIWGKDAIFTFHPFDERYYDQLDNDSGSGIHDNRHMNPALASQGIIAPFDASKHSGPFYQRH